MKTNVSPQPHLCVTVNALGGNALASPYQSPGSVRMREHAHGDVLNSLDGRDKRPLVLVGDGHVLMNELIVAALSKKYLIKVIQSEVDPVMAIKMCRPAIVLIPIDLPNLDGLGLCRAIKSDLRFNHVDIVLVKCHGDGIGRYQQLEALKSGADCIVSPPFDMTLLEAQIDALFERFDRMVGHIKYELSVTTARAPKSNQNDDFITRVHAIIEDHLTEPDFTVEQLSFKMGMSPSNLYRKLKHTSCLSANEVIRKYKIKKAEQLMHDRSLNISEIMYEVGFSNLSYFAKCFRAEFGMAPKEYQAALNAR